ncbi:PREDICTED: zinc finger BED domain-containing protein RICESLEEPER 2-like [Nicotiana attenuata]|uniref:zinc finger BED domain-containing protein RICESLEEPER 2-like n=1 Tax=Nicotiana attenuata TaxID=49451 RepID=UPI0009048D6B|nr:PREDICTED: zinc finger BED domain-containing protein RICESLEEPER 2-like [Nicotiana attenuata]
MAIVISKCLLDWGFDKVFTGTVDNASSNDVTVKELSKRLSNWGTNMMDGNHLHVRCMAHIINLIVQDGLKEIGNSIKRVRQAMKYIRQSPAGIKKFKDCCEMSNITCKKTLCLDVSTRWNSTYLMLYTTQIFQHAFERYKLVDHGLVNYLVTHVCEDGNCAGSLVSDDWNNVRNLVKFLETFYELTLKVSGSLYVTSNVHFSEISEHSCMLKGLVASEDLELQSMAVRIKEKFDKYWGEPEKMNKIIFIACVLDPRNKTGFVEFALEEMFGKEKGGEIGKDVIKNMNTLYKEYIKKNANGSQLPSPSSDSSNTSSVSSILTKGVLRLQYKKRLEENESSGVNLS